MSKKVKVLGPNDGCDCIEEEETEECGKKHKEKED